MNYVLAAAIAFSVGVMLVASTLPHAGERGMERTGQLYTIVDGVRTLHSK